MTPFNVDVSVDNNKRAFFASLCIELFSLLQLFIIII